MGVEAIIKVRAGLAIDFDRSLNEINVPNGSTRTIFSSPSHVSGIKVITSSTSIESTFLRLLLPYL